MRWHLAGSTAHHHLVYTTILYAKNDFGTASARHVIFNQKLMNRLGAGRAKRRRVPGAIAYLVTNN
jgi:hypothetical protein